MTAVLRHEIYILSETSMFRQRASLDLSSCGVFSSSDPPVLATSTKAWRVGYCNPGHQKELRTLLLRLLMISERVCFNLFFNYRSKLTFYTTSAVFTLLPKKHNACRLMNLITCIILQRFFQGQDRRVVVRSVHSKHVEGKAH